MEKEEFKIIDISENGKGISKKDSLVYFIKNAKLGDIVSIKNEVNKKNYIEAQQDKIILESKFRIKSECEYFPKCTNCIFQDLNYEKELDFKQNKVINDLKRIGKLNLENVKINHIKGSSNIKNYRNKISLKLQDGKLGYYKRGSNEIIEINKCIIADKNINKILEIIIKEKINLKYFSNLMIRTDNKNVQIEFIGNKLNEDIKLQINKLEQKIKEKTNLRVQIFFNDEKMNDENFKIDFLNYTFTIHPKSFFQVNKKQAERIYKEIKEKIEKKQKNKEKRNILIDLYSGVGVSSILFSENFNKVISIELNKEAVDSAKENARYNNVENISFIKGKAEENINNIKIDEENFIFVDPPRAGLDKKVIDKIVKSNVKNIIYMSCNSTTLARDLKDFSNSGYYIEEISIYDMFPRTLHVETVALLSKFSVDNQAYRC